MSARYAVGRTEHAAVAATPVSSNCHHEETSLPPILQEAVEIELKSMKALFSQQLSELRQDLESRIIALEAQLSARGTLFRTGKEVDHVDEKATSSRSASLSEAASRLFARRVEDSVSSLTHQKARCEDAALKQPQQSRSEAQGGASLVSWTDNDVPSLLSGSNLEGFPFRLGSLRPVPEASDASTAPLSSLDAEEQAIDSSQMADQEQGDSAGGSSPSDSAGPGSSEAGKSASATIVTADGGARSPPEGGAASAPTPLTCQVAAATAAALAAADAAAAAVANKVRHRTAAWSAKSPVEGVSKRPTGGGGSACSRNSGSLSPRNNGSLSPRCTVLVQPQMAAGPQLVSGGATRPGQMSSLQPYLPMVQSTIPGIPLGMVVPGSGTSSLMPRRAAVVPPPHTQVATPSSTPTRTPLSGTPVESPCTPCGTPVSGVRGPARSVPVRLAGACVPVQVAGRATTPRASLVVPVALHASKH